MRSCFPNGSSPLPNLSGASKPIPVFCLTFLPATTHTFMDILTLKALHVIGFVAWFTGLYYLGRLFVYHAEAGQKPANERDILQKQYQHMMKRVYKILCNPAMMLTWTFGIAMLALNPSYFKMGWLHIKLTLLVLLLVYHVYSKSMIRKMESGKSTMSDLQLRLYNEVPTWFLAGIVFTVVLGKAELLNYAYLGGGLIVFAALLYFGIRASQGKKAA